MLGSVSKNGSAHCSYAPFVRPEDDGFYIFISALAEHTDNLLRTGEASIMIIEDESETDEIFARRRLSLQCSAQVISRDLPQWHSMLDLLQERLGDTVAILRDLPDFSLVRLVPNAGTLVTGFANAKTLTPENSPLLRVK